LSALSSQALVARLLGPGRLSWQEESLPPIGDKSLFCRTLVSAISPGTELAAWRGAPPLRDIPAYPRLQGYCNVAEVLAVGSLVRRFSVGDRILTFTSHRSHFVCAQDEVLVRLQSDLPADEVSVAYLFHLGYNAVLRSGVRAGSRVAVIGLGALGLGAVALASLSGASVTAISNYDSALERARRFGAFRAERRSGLAGNADEFDVVISTTNSWVDWSLALRLAAPLGRIAVLGFPGREAPPGDFNPLDSRFFYVKQLRFEAVGLSPDQADARGFLRFNERENLQFIVDLIAAGRLPAREFVSARFPAAELDVAYRALADRKTPLITVVLQW
jgi:threonine dehydrogenase-like Zn-dependent dehydrogenase